jgi:uncharacterized protein (DUF4415 family)
MNGVKILSPERIAGIRAFKNTDFSDCLVMTGEELKRLRPRHPEYFKPVKKAVRIRLDTNVPAWFKAYGKGYQSRINAVLREVILRTAKNQEKGKTRQDQLISAPINDRDGQKIRPYHNRLVRKLKFLNKFRSKPQFRSREARNRRVCAISNNEPKVHVVEQVQ